MSLKIPAVPCPSLRLAREGSRVGCREPKLVLPSEPGTSWGHARMGVDTATACVDAGHATVGGRSPRAALVPAALRRLPQPHLLPVHPARLLWV